MKNPWRRLLIITSVTSGIGVLMPAAAYAACSPGSAADITVTCSGKETNNLDYTIDDRLTLILDNTSQLTSATTQTPAAYFRSHNGRLINQGSITTSGFFNDGIYISATADILLDNQASITAASSQSNGIQATEVRDSILSNRGTITTEGSQGNGIKLVADRGMLIGNEG